MDRIFAVWKPKGPTSHDIVDQIRRAMGEYRVGHAGTLDPLASGILVIATGKSTKLLGRLVDKDKEYIAKVKLGEYSSTDDTEGEKTRVKNAPRPKRSGVLNALSKFVGEIDQIPPTYSAVKIAGQRAYQLAREGKAPNLKPRRVLVKEIRLISYKWPYLKFRAMTGPGVYIRALARDIGQMLGSGGYLTELKRVRVGDFRKGDCISIQDLVKLKGK